LREKLHTLAEPLQARGLEVIADVAWHNPIHEGIEQEIECSGVQLVMKSTRPHSLMSRSFFSHSDWQLIRCCPAPLLLVKAHSWSARPRMLAAVDPLHPNDRPASLDRKILDAGRHLAEVLGGELHAIHVRPSSRLSTAASSSRGWQMPIFAGTDFAEAEEKKLRATIYDLTRSFGMPEDRVHIASGHVADALSEYAAREAVELIIMGAVSRSRVRDVFIGHAAEQVLESLSSDVLIIKSGDGTEAS
jgi:universal stress protein E